MKLFHLGDILSVTTDILVSPRRMEGVYDILNYMTGDNIYTHQIPRIMQECKPYLLEQHPKLRNVSIQAFIDGKNWKKWLNQQIDIYGEMLPVRPIPKKAHKKIDPIIEARFVHEEVGKKH